MIELEHPAETLLAIDLAFGLADVIDGIDKLVIKL